MHERVLAVRLTRSGGLPGSERRSLQRRAARGDLVTVRPGAFAEPSAVQALTIEERHLLLLRATAPMITPPRIVSHVTAAIVLGLPLVSHAPRRVHLTDATRTHAAGSRYTRVHTGRGCAHRRRWSFAGVDVSCPLDTVVDIAATLPLADALPMVDHALRRYGLTRSDALTMLDGYDLEAATKAREAISLGSALAESPAESLCRVRFHQLRTPTPVEQHVFARAGERPARVDFWFPAQGVVVEVDGRAKYGDDSGAADAHWREKRREDFIRSFPEVRTVVRLTWADLMDPERIRVALRRAGVPCR